MTSVAKPQLRRTRTIEYDRSALVPAMSKKLSFADTGGDKAQDDSRGASVLDGAGDAKSSNIANSDGSPVMATKSIRSALGTEAFTKTMEKLRESSSDLGYGDEMGAHVRTDDVAEIVDSISEALMDKDAGYGNVGTYRHRVTNVSFEPRGATWFATVVAESVEGDDKIDDREALEACTAAGMGTFRVRVVCRAVKDETAGGGGGSDGEGEDGEPLDAENGGDKPTTYAVDMDLLPDDFEGPEGEDDTGDGSDLMVDFGGRTGRKAERRLSAGLEQERQAIFKKMFDEFALMVKKAIVKCEFPEFPEGCKGRPFREVYQLNARLKSGSFATVCRGTHRATGRKIAIKCVLRKDLPPNDDAAVYDEVAILASLKHRYICPLIDFFDEKECYFLVMELMSGGDLFDRIGTKKTYDERDARALCQKMLDSMLFIHENNVAHCDMKPKNLLLRNDEDDSFIKLADFGFATRVYGPNSLTKQCGTPFFVAPEILMRTPYDQQSDMWSVGVIIFLLLSGNLPFMGRSQRELFRAIVIGKYEFDDEVWDSVSEHAKNLIQGLLVTDPAKRLTAKQALRSRWFADRGDKLAKHNLAISSRRLKTFNARMKLRSAMIAVNWASQASIMMRRLSSQRALMKGVGGSTSGTGMAAAAVIKEDEEEE